jgi:hypothetical protein
MNPPKKIHVWEKDASAFVSETPEPDDVAYIRADLVEELVKAVEEIISISDRKHDAWDKVKAKLKDLEML